MGDRTEGVLRSELESLLEEIDHGGTISVTNSNRGYDLNEYTVAFIADMIAGFLYRHEEDADGE